MEKSYFPCTSCGCCCRRIDLLSTLPETKDVNNILYFPYNDIGNGVCENLIDGNRCNIYETRPYICSIENMKNHFDLPEEEYLAIAINHCNLMMDKDNIDLDKRIK